jgi:hypothetical protein
VRQLVVYVLAVPLLAACAGTAAGPGGGSGSSPPASSGQPRPGRSTPPPTPTPTSPPPAPGGCTRQPGPVTVRPGERPEPVCLAGEATLRIRTEPSPLQPWTPLTSSNESVLRCSSRPIGDGAVEATCTAGGPGTATVSTSTAPFAGDPHGPPQEIWELQIIVTGP